ncbi:hypothetical protein K491DRAFT_722217 [Lophiostoma macrostomum CBS 122681]|uniref:Putative gamma-glutamylcyclotransferase n=1 Tax=Lophiostoma macrostomum CBS 122681 TaxID=1314788 RepID=A0A6A6SLP7_9PLEO|nr:hypothetical protein K491DRAFT_722217 [Lophiostoma macrostomum CBS 122681]
MDYLGELNQQTLDALTELNGFEEDCSPNPAPTLRVSNKLHKQSQNPHNKSTYLVKLEGPLDNVRTVASVAGLASLPTIVSGEGNDGMAQFCRLDYTNVAKLEAWAAINCPVLHLTKIRISIEPKSNPLPVLGVEPTFPQHRSQSATTINAPVIYPVWYFFYGTLADPELLIRLFGSPVHSALPTLVPALIRDGSIKIWGDKYKALVDRPGGMVKGRACQVISQDQEEALRIYEGENYEVVSTSIVLNSEGNDGECVNGHTFRFVGPPEQLSVEN